MLNNLIFLDDFVELWIKLNQRGLKFIFSKFSFFGKNRTISSFTSDFQHANWWIIPYLSFRRNALISGHGQVEYEQYVTEKYLKNVVNEATMVSLGCGDGSHERKFAIYNPSMQIN
jgi:hypothetical protein